MAVFRCLCCTFLNVSKGSDKGTLSGPLATAMVTDIWPPARSVILVAFLKQIPDTAPFHLRKCQEEQLVLPKRDKGVLSCGGISISMSVSFRHEGLSAFLT